MYLLYEINTDAIPPFVCIDTPKNKIFLDRFLFMSFMFKTLYWIK